MAPSTSGSGRVAKLPNCIGRSATNAEVYSLTRRAISLRWLSGQPTTPGAVSDRMLVAI